MSLFPIEDILKENVNFADDMLKEGFPAVYADERCIEDDHMIMEFPSGEVHLVKVLEDGFEKVKDLESRSS